MKLKEKILKYFDDSRTISWDQNFINAYEVDFFTGHGFEFAVCQETGYEFFVKKGYLIRPHWTTEGKKYLIQWCVVDKNINNTLYEFSKKDGEMTYGELLRKIYKIK